MNHEPLEPLTVTIDARTLAIIDATCPACAVCNTCHSFFINRDGKTRCISCDVDYQAGQA